ncbi:unnamed protein product, partial [Dicrocoelium dendriticum]
MGINDQQDHLTFESAKKLREYVHRNEAVSYRVGLPNYLLVVPAAWSGCTPFQRSVRRQCSTTVGYCSPAVVLIPWRVLGPCLGIYQMKG